MKKLGFGCMRLPLTDPGDVTSIDMPQFEAMVDRFLEQGFTYFDTAYVYHSRTSEKAVGQALVARHPRDSFTLATKLPLAALKTLEDRDRIFQEQLENCRVDYFDYYLLHNINSGTWPTVQKLDCFTWLRQKKAEGVIKQMGFSFHDSAALLDEILTAQPGLDFVQLQINYLDWENASIQSRLCYETARRHGKPVVIMEPVKGGSLANLPESVAKVFKAAEPDSSIASWALRYAASLDGLVTVLSGMSTVDQMKDNLSVMKGFTKLDEKQMAVIEDAKKALAAVPSIPCTSCEYCMKGCPQGIAIPRIFSAVNTYKIYNNLAGAKGDYGFATRGKAKASDCIACGQCEAVCPQHISVIEELKAAAELLE